FNITVIRDDIKVKSVRSRHLGDGYAYVRVGQFMEKTADDLKATLDKLRRENGGVELKGLLLDLRNDPGGLLTQAVKVADLFLKEGIIVYTDGRIESQKQKFYAQPRGTEGDYPIVVLVNSGSASASEIVAGALQDHGRALVLGTQTFGKGSVQTITPLENGGALTLTTALYYTASGRSLQATGVKPDIEVEEPRVKRRPGQPSERRLLRFREKDLEGAIVNPEGNGSGSGAVLQDGDGLEEEREDLTGSEMDKLSLKDWLEKDVQAARAFEIIKTFDVFKAAHGIEPKAKK
ncbi:MAG: peptidase S41, partial [Deltaproteobacteria bacterium]|nr:peptidase S41 [Deltaproteobacteria bacterium]